MKKLILFTLLSVLSLAGFSQPFGRLRIHSGLYDNLVINGPDTVLFGWRTDRFQLRNNGNVRFVDFIKSDSTVIIYNKLILDSPNDTMLSVRGNAKVDTLFYSALSPDIAISKRFIDITDYGAIGDGITINTVSIQNAINAAQDSGFSLYIPSGQYIIDAQLNISKSNMTIFGDGSNISQIKITTDNFAILITNAQDVNFRNIGITGTGVGVNQYGIYYYGNSGGTVESCYFWGLGGVAIMAYANYPVYVYNSFFMYINQCAIYQLPEYSIVSGNAFRNCVIGLNISNGNQVVSANSFFTCNTAIKVMSDNNDGHSSLVGNLFNHSSYSLDIDSISNGMTISSCYSWSSNAILKKSKGVKFEGCSFDSGTIFFDGSYSEMNDCQYKGSFAIVDNYNGHKSYNRISNYNAISDTLGYYNIKSDHSTDTSFVIESELGKKMTIYDSGEAHIGVITGTTDAMLIVDPTDSTITQLGMVKRTYVLTVNDDANLVLPDDFAGWVEVSALNSGTEDEYASFRINSDGTIAGLTFNTANVTLVLGTDGNLNIGTTSTKGVIENKLGGSRDFIVRIEGKLY